MQRFELFRILEGQPCRISFAESFDDANAKGAQPIVEDNCSLRELTFGLI